MRLERAAGGPAPGPWVGGALLAASAMALLWLHAGLPVPQCALREWTGLACATCGTTRMVRALLAGDLLRAVSFNPLSFSALVCLVAGSAWSLLRTWRCVPAFRVVLAPREKRWLVVLAAAVLAGSWLYQIYRNS
jgi:hypothetical protein